MLEDENLGLTGSIAPTSVIDVALMPPDEAYDANTDEDSADEDDPDTVSTNIELNLQLFQ